MLLPALNQARERSRSIGCVNNQRQISLGLLAYTNDFDDILFNQRNTVLWTSWLSKSLGYINQKTLSCPSDPLRGTGLINGVLGMYDYRGATAAILGSVGNIVVYPESGNAFHKYYAFNKLKAPSNSILVADSYGAGTQAGAFYFWPETYRESPNDFALMRRHSNLANCLMFDGHVASLNKTKLAESPSHVIRSYDKSGTKE